MLNNAIKDTISLTTDLLVKDPLLWDLDHPLKYTLTVNVSSGGRLLDTYTATFGIRTIRWDKQTGFWLNSKNVKLQGVCGSWNEKNNEKTNASDMSFFI